MKNVKFVYKNQNDTSYFVEGIQGSGKSTLTRRLSEKYPDHNVLEEGDYSPVELAWCAYMSLEDYQAVLVRFPELKGEIIDKSHEEDGRMVVCYTKIHTGDQSFYRHMEQYEIYNNRVPLERFKEIILKRYGNWDGEPVIAECSIFQNIVEDMILFRDMTDEEILGFYRDIKKAIGGKKIHIAYLRAEPDDIRKNLETARKERVDENGNEVWFSMLSGFFDNCPHAVRCGLKGEDGLVSHWTHRQDLELRICEEVFKGQYSVLRSKNYSDLDI